MHGGKVRQNHHRRSGEHIVADLHLAVAGPVITVDDDAILGRIHTEQPQIPFDLLQLQLSLRAFDVRQRQLGRHAGFVIGQPLLCLGQRQLRFFQIQLVSLVRVRREQFRFNLSIQLGNRKVALRLGHLAEEVTTLRFQVGLGLFNLQLGLIQPPFRF